MMKKSVAIPVRFLDRTTGELRNDLTEDEQEELKQFGDQIMSDEEEAEELARQEQNRLYDLNVKPERDIRNLEDSITPRRLREATLTNEGKAWLADIDRQIIAIRAQIKKG